MSVASRRRWNEKISKERAARRAERERIKNQGFEIELPPSPDISAEELIARRIDDFNRVKEYEEGRKLIHVDVKMSGPIGILHFGDPHVDDDGCDWPMLKHHVELVDRTPGLFAANVGDTRNNWVGRLARLFGSQGTSAKHALILAKWFVAALKGQWLYMVGGNHDCHDTETECLTKRGWVKFDDIRPDDSVLSFNPDNNAAEWSHIIGMVARDHDGEMVRIKTRTVSMNVTPNHRILGKRRDWKRDWKEWEFMTAGNLPARVMLPVAAGGSGAGVHLTDDEIRLAGWVLTDGSIQWQGNSPRVSIWQSKDGTEISRVLDSLGIKYTINTRNRDIKSVCGKDLVKPAKPQLEWRMNAEESRRVLEVIPEKGKLPEWAQYLTDSQFFVLLDALIAGDGCWDGADPGSKTVGVMHGGIDFLSSVQACAVAHGWNARISIARDKDARLNLCHRQDFQFETKGAVEVGHYTGKVWCLTVPLGNFMVRRDGAAHFSGNCWSGDDDPMEWIACQASALYESSEARLGMRFPNGRQVIINARHDFAGSSQWNPTHGPMKAAQLGLRDDVLICGHKHQSGYSPLKDPDTGKILHCIQVASYKRYDRYAREKGFRDQSLSPCVLTVIDPDAINPANLIQVFWDADRGAEYLTWLRSKAA